MGDSKGVREVSDRRCALLIFEIGLVLARAYAKKFELKFLSAVRAQVGIICRPRHIRNSILYQISERGGWSVLDDEDEGDGRQRQAKVAKKSPGLSRRS